MNHDGGRKQVYRKSKRGARRTHRAPLTYRAKSEAQHHGNAAGNAIFSDPSKQ
jgi:hypothetical protein